jgi:hypothetical protein
MLCFWTIYDWLIETDAVNAINGTIITYGQVTCS